MTKTKALVTVPQRGRALAIARDVAIYGGEYVFSRRMVSGFGPILAILAMCIVACTLMTHSAIPALVLLGVGALIVTGGGAYVGWDLAHTLPGKRIAERKERIREAKGELMSSFADLTNAGRDDTVGWLVHYNAMKALRDDEDDEAVAICNDVALRIADLHKAYETAIVQAGRVEAVEIKREALKAAFEISKAAAAAHKVVVDGILDADKRRLPDVTRQFVETARLVTGMPSAPGTLPPLSASAALQRLTGLAEGALKVDPDLTDSTGARIDALVRRHLPRLLQAHADAARTVSMADLPAVDAELADGVEQVRASIDEALAADARMRFDRLRDEVRFLHMRRGA